MLATRSTARTAGNGAGTAASGSVAATVATVARPSAVGRMRVSPRSRHHRSKLAWACSGAVSSARVRHQRWAAVWLAFSTTPLRLPRRAGQMATDTPYSLNLIKPGWG